MADRKHCDLCDKLLPKDIDWVKWGQMWAVEDGFVVLPAQFQRKKEQTGGIFGLLASPSIDGEDWKDSDDTVMSAESVEICTDCMVKLIGKVLDQALKKGLLKEAQDE